MELTIKYFDSIFPVHVGYCHDKKSWDKEMKRLGIKDEDYPDNAGRCTYLKRPGHDPVVLITVNPGPEHSLIQVASLLCHEAVHAFDFICEHIGEESPSSEFKAYTIQWIVQSVLQERERLAR